jgi:hypothetical protein
MFSGDRQCAFMSALRAQTCAQHYISSIGAQTAGLIETQIGTDTHWGNRHKLWESACAAHNRRGATVPRKGEAGERVRSIKGSQLRNIREYMNGTCRKHEARVCGARIVHSVTNRQFAVACGTCMWMIVKPMNLGNLGYHMHLVLLYIYSGRLTHLLHITFTA